MPSSRGVIMTQKKVNGGGIGGQIVLVNGEKYRVNPTKNATSTGALPKLPYGFGGNKSKPESETIR